MKFANSRLITIAARTVVLLVFGLTLCLRPATAQDASSTYAVGTGDVISIIVYGDEGLSGDFPVSPEGMIAYPILGNVAVIGLTAAEVGEKISQSLSQHIPGLTVSAAIAEYAPVFVVGDVNTPGKQTFRPGMIALELIALGGGIRRPSAESEGLQIQLIAARQDHADLELQLIALEAARNRLQAELEARDYEPGKETAVSDPALRAIKERILKGEARIFDARAAALASQDEALAAQERSYDAEIEKVTASIELHAREIELLMEDVDSQRKLVERGLTARSNLREVERSLSSSRRDALELGSYLARAQQNKLAIQQRRRALVEDHRNEAAAQIQEIDIDLARMRTRQRSLLDTMAALSLAAGEDAMEAVNIQPELSILRMVDGEYQEIAAGELARLVPGDILKVLIPQRNRELPRVSLQ